MNEEEARETAKQNLIMTTLPKLPESGDLSESDPVLIDMKAMGGVNGYAVSAYTKAPDACLAFIDFATSYEMVTRRSEMRRRIFGCSELGELHRRAAMRRRVRGTYRRKSMQISRTEMWC